MAIELKINTILRQNIDEPLEVGKIYDFTKDGLVVLTDNMQIWLASTDWTALADIQVLSQHRENGKTSGTFKVLYVYSGPEQASLTGIFRRMYAEH